MWPLKNFWGSSHITGTAEPKVIKFCTLVGYVSYSNRMTYHQQKGRGYGQVTVLKFCRLSWCRQQRVARVCQRQMSYLFSSTFKRNACHTSCTRPQCRISCWKNPIITRFMESIAAWISIASQQNWKNEAAIGWTLEKQSYNVWVKTCDFRVSVFSQVV